MITLFKSPVLADWIDYNGHMNDAYYVIAFSKAIDAFMLLIGIDEKFRLENHSSIYTLQSMVHYIREVVEREPIVIKGQLLESNGKKIRLFMTMYHEESNVELATLETLLLHVNTQLHKSMNFLPAIQSVIDSMQVSHNTLPNPALAGNAIRLQRVS
jgi:acyl-CoA thioester hydrolase